MSSGYKFETREELNTAVDSWTYGKASATKSYGDINTWDVSSITDFSLLFSPFFKDTLYYSSLHSTFNSNIINWDVSSGTNFYGMFHGALAFNQDISSWDVSSGNNFALMFSDADAFNQDIGGWDVSNGTLFNQMFRLADAFNQDIGDWDVSSGNNFSLMFSDAEVFNQDIGGWDVSNGTNFGHMFQEARKFNQDIGSWDVSNGTDFSRMFYWADAFNQDIGGWDVSNGTDFTYMFHLANKMNANGWSATPTASDFLGQTITGDATAESITGAGGNDVLSGLGGDDEINGGDGWDKLTGGSGDDILDGGVKEDTAIYTGKKDDYLITEDNSTFIVKDLRDDTPDGKDTLTNIEFIKFSDQVVRIEDLNIQESEPDTTAPDAPTSLATSSSITNNSTPTITGTAEANSTITLLNGIIVLGTANTDSEGAFSITPSAALADGDYSITATATDSAGNISSVSSSISIKIDTTVPNAPTSLATTSTNTNDTTPIITGTAEANSTITLLNGIIVLGTATTDSEGDFSVTPSTALADGPYSLTAKATDSAGNESALSSNFSVVIDTVPPTKPSSLSQISNKNQSKPTISGTAEANSFVTLSINENEVLGTASADSNGNFSHTHTANLEDGTYSITATSTDLAGNISLASSALSINIDTTTSEITASGKVSNNKEIIDISIINPITNEPYVNIFGTSDSDDIKSNSDEIVWGLEGNDILRNSGDSINDEILVGGKGDDQYIVEGLASVLLYEAEDNGYDSIILKDITIDDEYTSFFTLENKHLFLLNIDPLQGIWVIDFLDKEGFEEINLGGEVYSRNYLFENYSSLGGYLGDRSWSDMASDSLFENIDLAEGMKKIIEEIVTTTAQLSKINTEVEFNSKPTIDPIEDELTEPYQTVSASSDELSFYPGKDINFDLLYTTSDNDSALTGLGLKVHYDSSVFTPSGENNGVSALVDTFGDTSIVDDTFDDFDNDATTDKYINIIWADLTTEPNFPGTELPATLASLSFSSSKEGLDELTGESKESKINFTSTDPAQNYDFFNQSVTLKPQSFNLDVDGDGSVTALGDGLMVIRKLFGAAFAGDVLTNKAISNNATKTTDEIHEFIQAGMDEKVLDVDGDGSVTALGDGLMVIRKLFGAAFAGDALTSKALSNNATRTTDEIHEYIAAMSTLDTIA